MRLFLSQEIKTAMQYVEAGGQALHVYRATPGVYPSEPECFRRSPEWGHLIDNDPERLAATARRLGVRRVVVSRRGRKGQHVDLCGRPLRRALEETVP